MIKKNVILDCDFVFKCPKKWDKLQKSDDPKKRFCEACEREVYFITNHIQLAEHSKLGHCVAANAYDTRRKQMVAFAGEPRANEDYPMTYPDTTRLLVLGTEENRKELRAALKQMSDNKPVKTDGN